MILRLKLYSLSLKVATYLLPILAFYLGWCAWKLSWAFLGRPVLFSFHGHLNHMLFGTLVWAFVSERYRVTSFDELFRERTGARAAWSACLATSFVDSTTAAPPSFGAHNISRRRGSLTIGD